MIYFMVGVIGAVMLTSSVIYFWQKQDLISFVADKYTVYISTTDVSVSAGGISFSLKASKSDKEVAWRIYTQIKTRIASVKFDENYDSLYLSNNSLHKIFLYIRDEISKIPLSRIRSERDDKIVDFYLNILNEGIRPYLSKWHIPISNWVESEREKYPDESLLDIEKRYSLRDKALMDIKEMNIRMDAFAKELLKIVKS